MYSKKIAKISAQNMHLKYIMFVLNFGNRALKNILNRPLIFMQNFFVGAVSIFFLRFNAIFKGEHFNFWHLFQIQFKN